MIHSDVSTPRGELPLDHSIQIVLFGDHRLLLDSLACRLESETDIRAVHTPADWCHGIGVCRDSAPEIALIDLDVTAGDPFDIAAELSAAQTLTRVVFLAQQFTDASIEKALEVQASGLLLTRETMANLIVAVRRICRGHFCFSSEIERRLAYDDQNHAYTISPGSGLSSLTDRQKEVLMHLALGLSVKEVARRLNLSNKSVDSHKYRIMNKLGINDRVKLARFAIREGLVEV